MIRKAKVTDIPAIIHLGQELTKRGAWSFTSIDFASAVGRLRDGILSSREWVGVAEHRGKIVGFMILVAQPMWWNPKQWQVVDDITFCTRAGMGRALLRAGLEWAFSMPMNVEEVILSLNAEIDTPRSARALELHGMRRRGVTLSVSRAQFKGIRRWAA